MENIETNFSRLFSLKLLLQYTNIIFFCYKFLMTLFSFSIIYFRKLVAVRHFFDLSNLMFTLNVFIS